MAAPVLLLVLIAVVLFGAGFALHVLWDIAVVVIVVAVIVWVLRVLMGRSSRL